MDIVKNLTQLGIDPSILSSLKVGEWIEVPGSGTEIACPATYNCMCGRSSISLRLHADGEVIVKYKEQFQCFSEIEEDWDSIGSIQDGI